MQGNIKSILLICALSLYALQAQAQAQAPVAYSAKEIRGQIVDEDIGTPLEGVIVVARWEWHKIFRGDEPISYGSDVLHMSEVMTDKNGNYVIPGWGPKSKESGYLDDQDDPRLLLFKSGYVPLQLHNAHWTDYMRHNPASARSSEWNGKTVKLRKFAGTPKEYAEQLAKFQGGLAWRTANDNWRAMPRMIAALHGGKIRLGVDGGSVLGANQLFGRSGQGVLLDAETGKSVWPKAIINITWTLRRADGAVTRRFVQQKLCGVNGVSVTFPSAKRLTLLTRHC